MEIRITWSLFSAVKMQTLLSIVDQKLFFRKTLQAKNIVQQIVNQL